MCLFNTLNTFLYFCIYLTYTPAVIYFYRLVLLCFYFETKVVNYLLSVSATHGCGASVPSPF